PQSEVLFLQSLAILEKTLGPDHHKVAAPIGNLASFYERREDYARAEPLYRRALSILEKALGPNHPDVAAMLNKIAHFYAAKGDGQQALNFLSRANAAREWSIQHTLSLGSERQKLRYLNRFAEDTDTALSLHAQLNPKDQSALELAFTTLLQRKGRALDAMSDNFAILRARATPEDQALLTRLSNAQTKLAAFSFRKPDKDTVAYQANLKKLEVETDNLEAEVSSRSLEFRSQGQAISLNAIQSLLPGGTTLIEYALYKPIDPKGKVHAPARYSAYLLSADGKAKWVDLGEATPIDQAIEHWRKALRDPERSDVSQLSRIVDERVMRPIRTVLGPRTKLLISPDGPLNLIPFAALTDEQGRYLAETSTITYLTSGRDLLRLQVARATRSGPVIVADPAFGEPALIASNAGRDTRRDAAAQVDYAQIFFGPLPGVGDEVRALKQLLPNAIFLTQNQATKEALKKLSGPSILHIATHGFFLEDVSLQDTNGRRDPVTPRTTRVGKWVANINNPLLRSGLALAGANEGANGSADGVLTALEAAGLDLWGTKLVVLSACDTGVGEVKNGDGVYGLRRALVLAGAESQLMSLWPAADRSTRELMVGYYKALTQGAGRGEALREVQLQMLHSKTHNHPYYWASFIQTGEWANLNGKR
ncbi:MAG TPA: CHAT domain-containing tetratricopeptide repeat protein, partial [Pyrinomonadaceae bacterium]